MQRRILFVALATMALSACFASENPAAGGETALAAAREQVNQRTETWLAATRAGDIDAASEHWTADVRMQEAGVDLAGGAIVQFAKQFSTTHRITAVELTPTETVAYDGGAVVYQLGHYTETVQARDGSAPPSTVHNNFVARWVRGEDGVYRLHRLLGTPRPDDAQGAAAPAQSADVAAGLIDDRLARQQIAQRMDQYAATLRANDLAAIASFWTDDAAYYDPGNQQIGKPSITRVVGKLLADNRVTHVDPKIHEIYVHNGGSTAYVFGNVVEVFAPKAGTAAPSTAHLNFVLRWRRGADGHWRIDRLYGTPQPTPASSV